MPKGIPGAVTARGLASAKWRANNPEAYARLMRQSNWRAYGVTDIDQAEQLYQDSTVCAACGEPAPDGQVLHLDHDHATGKPRGMLCGRCNRGIGMFDDSPAKLRAAIAYLEAHA
ncbi:HNH endonuclease [Microbacterium phage Didgeridoo]|uniref:HNH endonuclease n=1 Tax=Microbacterium phage Didgeridoo TaxID=2126928 RepID=UPI000D2262DB|nr:HNH endonuclease [Microbacterium phage Didgeridoo]AVR56697.1 HNH endonuclease [Microbacterium phage Didgeridoo]WMI34047.1 endonuclease VII [Microbacterium phage Finalfrontier]